MASLDLRKPAQLPIVKSTTLVAGEVRRVLLPGKRLLAKLDVSVLSDADFKVILESVPAEAAAVGSSEYADIPAGAAVELDKLGHNPLTGIPGTNVIGLYVATGTPTVKVMLGERRADPGAA